MKNFFKHPITASVISSFIILAIITPFVSYVKSIPLIESIKVIWEVILSVLNFGVPIWIIICFFVVFWIIVKVLNSKSSTEIHPFNSYKEDIIEGVKWEWEWIKMYDGSYDVNKNTLVPTCKKCKGLLILKPDSGDYYYSDRQVLYCEHCDSKHKTLQDPEELINKVKREIIRKVRSGEWKLIEDIKR
ncbi:hypothetical protein NV379_02240 [Paenibacillus sp. N1-5-1-14]|uniref:hypothetical protein n=1 Tax=Paenibacillus radicibacter TaxID=2972488 RepID=UPI0021598DA4|nr:hypothetical protein [Paenibacillus radicibacter]MCR8641466.1 hypothetical protein [Paenibacillus radicibacter]